MDNNFMDRFKAALDKREKPKKKRVHETFILIDMNDDYWEWSSAVIQVTDEGFEWIQACCPGEKIYKGHDIKAVNSLYNDLLYNYTNWKEVKVIRLNSNKQTVMHLGIFMNLLKRVVTEDDNND